MSIFIYFYQQGGEGSKKWKTMLLLNCPCCVYIIMVSKASAYQFTKMTTVKSPNIVKIDRTLASYRPGFRIWIGLVWAKITYLKSTDMLFFNLIANSYGFGLSNEQLLIIKRKGAAKLSPVEIGGPRKISLCDSVT